MFHVSVNDSCSVHASYIQLDTVIQQMTTSCELISSCNTHKLLGNHDDGMAISGDRTNINFRLTH